MAIETTNFRYVTDSSGEDNKAEVLAWLQSNAADYFDSIEDITSYRDIPEIKLTKGNSYFTIVFARNNSGECVVNGADPFSIARGDDVQTFSNAYKTQNGFALKDYRTGFLWIFSKSKLGHTCFAGVCAESNYDTEFYCTWFDFDASAIPVPAPSSGYSIDELYNVSTFIETTAKCVIFPLVYSGGDYSENTFRVPIITNKVLGVVSLDNTEYVTDSIFALKA